MRRGNVPRIKLDSIAINGDGMMNTTIIYNHHTLFNTHHWLDQMLAKDGEEGNNEAPPRQDKGGHTLLKSLSPSHGYFQTSPYLETIITMSNCSCQIPYLTAFEDAMNRKQQLNGGDMKWTYPRDFVMASVDHLLYHNEDILRRCRARII